MKNQILKELEDIDNYSIVENYNQSDLDYIIRIDYKIDKIIKIIENIVKNTDFKYEE